MGEKSSTKKYLILVIIAMAIIIILLSAFMLFKPQIQGVLPVTKVSTPTPTPYYVPVPTPTPYYAPIPTPTLSLPTSKPDFTITNIQTPILEYQNSVSFYEDIGITSINGFSGQVFLSSYSWIGTQPAGVIIDNSNPSIGYGNTGQNNVLISPNEELIDAFCLSIYSQTSNVYPFQTLVIPPVGTYTLQITITGNGISHSVDVTLEIYASS